MLKELIRDYSVIHIAGEEYRVCFSLNALLCLEMMYKPLGEILAVSFLEWSTEDVLQLTRAALCDLPENSRAVNDRNFEAVRPFLYELGQRIRPEDIPALSMELIEAISASMPEPDNNKEQTEGKGDEGDLRALCVDVIGIPENEFWRSNQKELGYRIDKYRKVKGFASDEDEEDPEIIVKMYDDLN